MKIRFFSLFVAVFFLLALMLSGCISSDKELSEEIPIALVVLAGKHANSQEFDVQLDAIVQRVYSTFGNVGIVVIDGNPTLLYNEDTKEIAGCYSIQFLTESKANHDKNSGAPWERNYLGLQVASFGEAFDKSIADDPEVDTLKALKVAEEALNTIEASMGTKVKKEILILDTGLYKTEAKGSRMHPIAWNFE